MAGKLIQIATNTVTSPVSSVTLTGIDSDDVYMIAVNNAKPNVDGNELRMRFTVSGTAQTTSNYDWATKFLRASTSFTNDSDIDQTGTRALNNIGTDTGENSNAIYYLYNFNDSSEFSFVSIENTGHNGSENRGFQGGTIYTVAETHDGVQFYNHQGNNISNGTFTLYKVV